MSDKAAFEHIYSKPGAIWTQDTPPEKLATLVENGVLKPGKVLDSACGEGTAAVYLAREGFDVTGIDFSEKAIEYAHTRATEQGAEVNFMVMDALEIEKLSETFNFVFEWGLIHHLSPEQVELYIEKVSKVLIPGGLYMTNTFNIESEAYGQKGEKVRKTPLGTELYYYTQEEMRALFSKHFDVIEEEIVPLQGKGISQPGNFFLLRKKSDGTL
jgi:cyclopropane fatty-acyl-phospholipid synthase-like methyltransferase